MAITITLPSSPRVVREAVLSSQAWVLGVIVSAILIRLFLASIINHTWDAQIWWNVFADLNQPNGVSDAIREPYERMRELSLMARSEQKGMYYEYWAYPPGMLYLYYPLAKLYGMLDSSAVLTDHGPYSFVVMELPIAFTLIAKLPNIVADLLIGGLLWRMIGKKGAIWYLFNPYVLLMGAWVFDGVMVASIILAVYLQEKGKTVAAALCLAAGAAIKFVPLFLAPAFIVYLMRKPEARFREVLLFGGAFAAGLLLLVLPAMPEFFTVLAFHSERFGGGLTWQTTFHALAANIRSVDWFPVFLVYLGEAGTVLLPLGILWGSVYLYRKRLSLVQLCLGMTLIYLAFTKLVNEAYLLPVLALATIELARNPSAQKSLFRWLFWLIPLLWALVNVPAQAFLVGFAANFGWVTHEGAKLFYDARLKDINILLIGLGVAGVVMTFLYLAAIPAFTKEKKVNIESDKHNPS